VSRYYTATVRDNDDDDKRGKLQLVIPELTGPDDPYPEWVEPRIVAGGPDAVALFWLPPVDAIVIVEADDGGGLRWLGSTVGDLHSLPAPILQGYPLVSGMTSQTGKHAVYLDENPQGGVRLIASDTGAKIILASSTSSSTHKIMLGDSFLSDLQTVLTEIASGLAGVPFPATQTTAMAAKIATALSAGAPYLSLISETE
jgi:hypothetical protein